MSESNEKPLIESVDSTPENEQRREFLGSLGKWSGASVLAAVGAAAWISTAGNAKAGWMNGRGGRGGGWINGGGGGGGWVNRRGGGGWLNRR
jgi:hypothetical protein